MELSIQERLKDLRVERGLTLEQLAEETKLSKSALGSYEADDLKDISHYALIKLAKFYEVRTLLLNTRKIFKMAYMYINRKMGAVRLLEKMESLCFEIVTIPA